MVAMAALQEYEHKNDVAMEISVLSYADLSERGH